MIKKKTFRNGIPPVKFNGEKYNLTYKFKIYIIL